MTELRDSQGKILRCWHRSLKLHGCQGEATETIFRRHQRTMDYRSQAEAARAAYIQLAEQACDAVAELPRGAPSGCKPREWQDVKDWLQERFCEHDKVHPVDIQEASAHLRRLGVDCNLPDFKEASALYKRQQVLMRASNHRAPVVGPWEPRTDAYTEYFHRSPAKGELQVLQQWFDVTLPAVRQYRQALQDGVALERRSLGQVEIRY